MGKTPIGTEPVGIQIATQQGMVTLSARQLGGQPMEWTTSILDGYGRMGFAITKVTANRMHACVRAWATLLVRLLRRLGINSHSLCLLRSMLLMLLCAAKILGGGVHTGPLCASCSWLSAAGRIAIPLMRYLQIVSCNVMRFTSKGS